MSYFTPYVCDVAKWKRHFALVGEGKVQPQSGFYSIESSDQRGGGSEPTVKLETPTQGVVERAKKELKRTSQEVGFDSGEGIKFPYFNKRFQSRGNASRRKTSSTVVGRKGKTNTSGMSKKRKKITKAGVKNNKTKQNNKSKGRKKTFQRATKRNKPWHLSK